MKYIKTFEKRYKQEEDFEIPDGTKLLCVRSDYHMFKVGDIVEMNYYKAYGGVGYYSGISKNNTTYSATVIDANTVLLDKYQSTDATFTTDATIEDYKLRKATEKYNL